MERRNLMDKNIQSFFDPKNIAIVGVSHSRKSFGMRLLKPCTKGDFNSSPSILMGVKLRVRINAIRPASTLRGMTTPSILPPIAKNPTWILSRPC